MSGGHFERVFSGAPWEGEVGYCRALRAGSHIHVTGTAPVAEGGGVHAPGDAYEQARRCWQIVAAALAGLGADLSSVVRTRMFVTDITRWRDYGRAHREAFGVEPNDALEHVAELVFIDLGAGLGDQRVGAPVPPGRPLLQLHSLGEQRAVSALGERRSALAKLRVRLAVLEA